MALTGIQSYVLKQLHKGKEIDGAMVAMLIKDFMPTATHKKGLYDRYNVSNLPIQKRTMPDGVKVNNQLNNDFVGEIIDTKIGYMFGTPIKYAIDKNIYGDMDEQYKKHQGHINQFVVRNRMNDKDIELGKLVSVCGLAGREIYIDKNGNEKLANLNPWEVIFLTNVEDEVEYALRFYTELRMGKEELEETIIVEFFDSEKITYFKEIKSDDGSVYELDNEQEVNPKAHIFGVCPIVKVMNNEEEMGDTERVVSLIDAYDRTMSDMNSEIEQFRSAYMYFKGEEPTSEMIEKAKQSGGFYVGEDGEIGFITKNINDQAVENHLNRLEEGINRFSKHVNMSDPNYGGGDSSLANEYKLNAMEMKSKMLEVKMKGALLRQFEILTLAWAKKGIAIDYINVFFTFTRNLPANILDEAQTSVMLKGVVSERTRLEQLSFVDDVDYELEQMMEDNERIASQESPVEDRVNLDAIEDEEV